MNAEIPMMLNTLPKKAVRSSRPVGDLLDRPVELQVDDLRHDDADDEQGRDQLELARAEDRGQAAFGSLLRGPGARDPGSARLLPAADVESER